MTTAIPDTDKPSLESSGAFCFITHRVIKNSDGSLKHWHSRHHRKGFHHRAKRQHLNWWIGGLFSLGASLFVFASLLCLMPSFAEILQFESSSINAVFFVGSIPFTAAAYLQLFQTINQPPPIGTPETDPAALRYFGWMPKDVGWLSCIFQFVGTVFFNFNTLDAMLPGLSWFQYDLVVWMPNIMGSILFLLSGYLAFAEVCHRPWSWKPTSLSWWIVFINFLGCVAFLVSGIASILLPNIQFRYLPTVALTCTLAGAICFLASSLLMLLEPAAANSEVSSNSD